MLHIPLTEDNTIELVDNFEFTEDFKKKVCLPYFKEVYQNLVERSEKPQKGVNKVAFFDYFDLPGLIGERFFQVLDVNKDGFIDSTEFISGIFKFYFADFEVKMKFIFDMYDFDNDQLISKEDIKTFLAYVPLQHMTSGKSRPKEGKFTQEGGGTESFQNRIESIEQLSEMVDVCLGEHETIGFKQFETIMETVSSEMFICVFNLIRAQLPDYIALRRYERKKDEPMCPSTPPMSKRFASPKILSKFGPVSDVIRERKMRSGSVGRINIGPILDFTVRSPREDEEDTGEESKVDQLLHHKVPVSKFKPGLRPAKIDTSGMVTLQQKYKLEAPGSYVDSPINGVAVRMPNSNVKGRDVLNSPSVLFRGRSHDDEEGICFCECGRAILEMGKYCDKCIEKKFVVKTEGDLYRKKNATAIKFWFVLEGKSLYSYESEEQNKHIKMYNIHGLFVREELEEVLEKKVYYPFTLSQRKKGRTFYAASKEDREMWSEAIKKAIGYANIFDYYDIQGGLGKGRFGTVRLGVHKKTQNQVAIKVMKRSKMSEQDAELVKLEIEIMKIAQHPNIIRLLDVFENMDTIFIVMELLKGGDLFTYLEKRKFKIPESRACQFTHSLSTAVFYLHTFGIVHRDIKPENILMTDESEESDIKLVDFGLSKIIGPNELCNEPFGTLSYVGPEVLLQKPYGKSVDIWSIGILAYLFLSGTLPFDDDDQREVVRQTIYDPPNFSHSVWKKVSKEGISFIKSLLAKSPARRMSLKEVLQHPWVTKYAKEARDARKSGGKISTFKAFAMSEPGNSPKIFMEEAKKLEDS